MYFKMHHTEMESVLNSNDYKIDCSLNSREYVTMDS